MKIEIFSNPIKDTGYCHTDRAVSILQRCGAEVWLPEQVPSDRSVKRGLCPAPDAIVVLGGDGSMMRAAHRAAELHVPILGINLGRLGYLAEVDPDEMEMLALLCREDYVSERRMMLDVRLKRNGEITNVSRLALNDAVVTHGRVSKLLDIEIACNGSSLGRYRCDGFIVTTPTGSTAYSLAAGGPILDPALSAIGLTPICPHSLLARPIIIPDTSEIEIRYLAPTDGPSLLTVDGYEPIEMLPGDSAIVTRSTLNTEMIRLNRTHQKSFYDILREKMSDI